MNRYVWGFITAAAIAAFLWLLGRAAQRGWIPFEFDELRA